MVYINPPYAEAGNIRQLSGTGKNKEDVAVNTKTYDKYLSEIGIAGRELYAQFFIRISREIPGCVLAEFSKLKVLQAPNFKEFRKAFNAKLEKLFVVPARTFDNVKGSFPIGFFVWRTEEENNNAISIEFKYSAIADAYDSDGAFLCTKKFSPEDDTIGNIGKWVLSHKDDTGNHLGFMSNGRNDFQNQSLVYFMNDRAQMPTPRGWWITPTNLVVMAIFVAVRHCIEATWLNDRDQFLYPNDGWKTDKEFQTDCLIFTLFHGQNRISVINGVPQLGKTALPSAGTQMSTVNHWIPFTREQVGCKKTFKSTFMADYLNGRIKTENSTRKLFDFHQDSIQHELSEKDHELSEIGIGENSCVIHGNSCENNGNTCNRIIDWMSPEARAVYDAGLALWRYYHAQPNAIADASFYDIRLHFQGTNDKGTMNAKSDDETYTELITTLRGKMKLLAKRIEPKVYEYGFLK